VGRTDSFTPVGKLEASRRRPVSSVQNVTLHNEDYIKGIGGDGEQCARDATSGSGDTVVIQRAGGIPKVLT
jgi:DNA ligase (NAD+)